MTDHEGAHGPCSSPTCLSCDCVDRLITRLKTIEQELVSACELQGLTDCSVRTLVRHLRNNYLAANGALQSIITRLETRITELQEREAEEDS